MGACYSEHQFRKEAQLWFILNNSFIAPIVFVFLAIITLFLILILIVIVVIN